MDSAALIAQLQGELGKQFTPESTLNAIGQPLYQSAKQELDLDQAQRQQTLTNLLNSRGLVGSGIEQQNNQIFQQNMANRAKQALQDAILHQNTLGLNEFQQGRGARVQSLLDLLRGSQQSELARAQQTLQERLAQLDAQTRAQLADKELAARNSFAQLQAQLQRDEALRREALEQRLREQQAQSLAAILGQQQSQAASAANAAGFIGGVSGLDRPFDPFNGLGGLKPYNEVNPGPLQGLNTTANSSGTPFPTNSLTALFSTAMNRFDEPARSIAPFLETALTGLGLPSPVSSLAGSAAAAGLAPPRSVNFGFSDAQRMGNVAPGRNPVNPFVGFIDTPFRTPFTPNFAPIGTSLFGPSAPGATAARPLPLFGSAGFMSAPGSRTNPFTLAYSHPFGA